jgi:threonyl-tRNA synthetase
MDIHANPSLYKLRHSLAHVLAQAVLQLRPNAKLAFGPPIDTGCYYDFLFDTPLTPEDFADIEKRMRRIINERQEFIGEERPLELALKELDATHQNFKAEYCRELGERGEKTIGFFRNGPFEDMCAGPHLEHTGQIPPDCFAIDSIAGAYWRGSEKNPQLSRLYCLAFENRKELDAYRERRKLAMERDHRKLGKELELFLISDAVGPGLPLWMPNGTVLREELENLAKEEEQRCGYVRVSTPHIAKETLYEISGHLPYYADSMFPPMNLEGESKYYLKAMNCPHHHMIYSHRPRSYRELPLKLAEFGTVYRYEQSGSLSGLLRVRSIAQNDAHIYCTLDQLKAQLKETVELTLSYFNRFRFQNIAVRFSTHDPANKEKFLDQPELWSFSERVVQEIVEENGLRVIAGPGEAAFYGPKLDFQATTLLGREESIATTQLDFGQPMRFDLKYTGEDGKEHRPYVIHRAPLGSHERFMAFLIEHLGGAFPTWLAPIQVMLIPVSAQFETYVKDIEFTLKQNLIRVETDWSDNSFNKKIREAVTRKIPNMVIIGGKEVEQRQITLRRYCVKEQVTLDRDAFIERMKRLKAERLMDNFADVEI